MISWTTDEVIHRIVSRDIPESDRGTIATLNDLPDWMVFEAGTIARESPMAAVTYVKFYVAREHAAYVPEFVEEVLRNGEDARTWNIRDCICIPQENTRLTALEINYLSVLAKVEGERWFRVRPNPSDHPSDYISGSIGIILRNRRYWHTSPPGITRYLFDRPDEIEVITPERLQTSMRRWIAHRLAWWASSYLKQPCSDVTGADIIAAVPDVNLQRVTPDARVAADALARETLVYRGSPSFPQQAGFLGLEEWYQSSSPASSPEGTADI